MSLSELRLVARDMHLMFYAMDNRDALTRRLLRRFRRRNAL